MSSIRPALVALLWAGAAVALTAAPARADVVGTVRGTLTGADHKPLAGLAVTIAGERFTATALTSASGRFAFARVPFGRYVLNAAAPDVLAITIDVASDAVVDVDLRSAPVIGRSGATSTGVRGTPVSQNAYGARQLAALPRNDSLAAIVETVPGVVTFSYGEPVAHGFHGLSYELDGAPLPQSTSANFSQLIDPRNAAAVEVFTGAFPAEFGGSRQGALINVVSGGTESAAGGGLTLGAGEQATNDVRLVDRFMAGRAQIALALNAQRSDRGLDAPTRNAMHDDASTADQFVRIALPMGERDLLAADVSNQFASFAIPLNTNPHDPTSPFVSVPGTDDVQHEYDRFASLSYTHTDADGNGYLRIVPWVRYDRVVYGGDLDKDVKAYVVNADGSTTTQNGLRQDRVATYTGLRLSMFRAGDHHAVKAGLDLSQETFASNLLIRIAGAPDFFDDAAARGTQTGIYLEDKWTPTARLAVNAGVRYDHSTGYVGGAQLSPRLEINAEIAPATVLHAYAGRLYAAPGLEDVRRDAIVTQTTSSAAPIYDLKPERDTYLELGLAHTFGPGLRAYINAFDRTAVNVLDTTQLANTPLFAVFNNTIGRNRGIETRFVSSRAASDLGLSGTYQRALAGGISGGTFLFDPGSVHNLALQPEDHDQTWTANGFYTRRFGAGLRTFATIQTSYGTGFPVQFQSGSGRLPAHWTVDASFGRQPGRTTRALGYSVALENLLDGRYLIKANNGFNTTQWNAPRRIVVRLTAPW